MGVYHWLVQNGLYPSIVGTVVLLVITHLIAWRWLRNAFHQIRSELARTNDLLDTSTPGGLADLLPDKPSSP